MLIGGLISSISVTVWLVYMGGTYMLGGKCILCVPPCTEQTFLPAQATTGKPFNNQKTNLLLVDALLVRNRWHTVTGAIEQQQQQQQQWEVSTAAGNVAAASILARGTNLGGILNDVVVNDTPIRNDDINAVAATIQADVAAKLQADAAAELQADAAAAAAAADTLATAMAAASGFNVGHEPVGEEYVDILVVVEVRDEQTNNVCLATPHISARGHWPDASAPFAPKQLSIAASASTSRYHTTIAILVSFLLRYQQRALGAVDADIAVLVGSKASDVPTLLLNGMPSIFKYVDKVGHVYIVGTAEACRALNTWLASITGDSNGARLRISVVSEQSFGFKLDDMRGQLNSFQGCCVCAARRTHTPEYLCFCTLLRSVHAWYGCVR